MSCYFIFILDYRNDVKQKENLSDFFEFKMGCKEVETTLNISNTFGTGTANTSAVEVQQRLEPWRWGAQWPAVEVDYGQLRAIIEADPLTTIQEVAKEFNINHSMVIQHLKPFHGHLANWKVEKNLMSGCLMSWPKIK